MGFLFAFSAIAVIAIVIFIVKIVIIIVKAINDHDAHDHNVAPWVFEPEEKRVGRRGERIATNFIKKVLREDDYLFTNVPVSYEGKNAELDNVIVNKYVSVKPDGVA